MVYKEYTLPEIDGPNGDLSTFPREVFEFFLNPSVRPTVTEKWIQDTIGDTTIHVQEYDIYTMGKRKKDRNPFFWTRLRIMMRESGRNVFQGNLGVRFTGGFGLQNSRVGGAMQMLRPINIRDMVTEDVSDFKKRSAIHLGGGKLAMLSDVEPFCEFPFYTTNDMKFSNNNNKVNSRKRKYYAKKMEEKNQWPHITRKSISAGNKNKLLKMILPYRKNLPHDIYFREFYRDISSILSEIREDFNIPESKGANFFKVEEDVNVDDNKDLNERSLNESLKRKNCALENDEALSKIRMDTVSW